MVTAVLARAPASPPEIARMSPVEVASSVTAVASAIVTPTRNASVVRVSRL